MQEVDEAALFEVAGHAVEGQVGVPAAEYTMSYAGLQNGAQVVRATHADDLDPSVPVYPGGGGGKSRVVLIDPETLAVKAVLREQ